MSQKYDKILQYISDNIFDVTDEIHRIIEEKIEESGLIDGVSEKGREGQHKTLERLFEKEIAKELEANK